MPDIFYLLSKWRKQIIAVIILSLIAVTAIHFLVPAKYMSVATALPASSSSSDKAGVFNENVEILYSALGSADELDIVTGTAQLDTVYLDVADQFDLIKAYKLSGKTETLRARAAAMLKKNTGVYKSEFGQLKIKVWDKNKYLSPLLANAILDKLQSIHTSLKNSNNKSVLNSLVAGKIKVQSKLNEAERILEYPASAAERIATSKKLLNDQLLQYDKLISEYELMVDTKAPALLVVERARMAIKPDRPNLLVSLAATAVVSFLFALLAALILDRNKAKQ